MDDWFPIAMVCSIVLLFVGVLGVSVVSTYYSNTQKLECIEHMASKPATDILTVCGKISS